MSTQSTEPPSPHPPEPPTFAPAFRLAQWRVEPAGHRLDDGEREQRLEPRVMALLVHLAERSGTPVSRRELLDHVWSDVVVGDEALTMAMSKLRRALGDDPRSPRFVETIAKGGYRLMTEVEPEADEPSASPPSADVDEPPSRRRRGALGALAVTGLAGVVAVVIVLTGHSANLDAPSSADGVVEPLRATRLTSRPGAEIQGELSPDGRRVAFVRQSPDRATGGLVVLDLDAGSERRLLDGSVVTPTWSPDGREIATTACDETGCRIVIVPAAAPLSPITGDPRMLNVVPASV